MGLHPIALRARSLRAVLLVQQVEGTESKSLHSTYECTRRGAAERGFTTSEVKVQYPVVSRRSTRRFG